MDVIFLDIDGVMVSYRSVRLAQLVPFRQQVFLSLTALRALRRLVKKTGAKIVIISSWRGCGEPYEWFKRHLARNGTPVYSETEWLEDREHDRSDEIFQWLQTHPTEHYVVLDDNNRFANRLSVRSHWIPVDAMKGLRMDDVKKAVTFFENIQ